MDKNFVRIGKWFVRPYDKDEKPVNKRSVFRVLLSSASSSLTTPVFALRFISSCCSWPLCYHILHACGLILRYDSHMVISEVMSELFFTVCFGVDTF